MSMTKEQATREALRMALEALEYEPIGKTSGEKDLKDQAITAIKEALSSPNGEAQPEQRNASEHLEPVACVGPWHNGRLTLIPRYSQQTFERDQPLYTTPPQRTAEQSSRTLAWVGLDEIDTYKLWKNTPLLIGVYTYADVAKEVETLLKEKNA